MEHTSDNQYSVSVVIPAYNSDEYISRTLDSVLNQSLPADEIIVIDDGSTDNTQQIVQKYLDKVTYLYQQNAGASVARNAGIIAAKGKWIAFLDSDDEWTPNKLQLQVENLKRNPDLVWTAANFNLCRCDLKIKQPKMQPDKVKYLLNGKEYHSDFFKAFIEGASGCTVTMLIKKDVLLETDLFTPGQLMANDIDMWFRIAYLYPKIGFIPEPLATYHLSVPMSISKKHNCMDIRLGLLKKHTKLAAAHNRLDAFNICVKQMVTSWIRSLLFDNKPEYIKIMLKDYGYLLDLRFRFLIKILLVSPSTTATICKFISRTLQLFKLNKKMLMPQNINPSKKVNNE